MKHKFNRVTVCDVFIKDYQNSGMCQLKVCTSTDRQGGRRRTESGAAAGLEEISERLMLVAEWRAGDVELCSERVAV